MSVSRDQFRRPTHANLSAPHGRTLGFSLLTCFQSSEGVPSGFKDDGGSGAFGVPYTALFHLASLHFISKSAQFYIGKRERGPPLETLIFRALSYFRMGLCNSELYFNGFPRQRRPSKSAATLHA
ncbi:yippee family protein [Coccidioides immitis RMSCC 3703]|uniref:Yippee family protein n=2 Tax=Coccidioides immitis TaxID=5501 RepID=A0A0J8R529_COCIT|nr:yippee-PA [Coccidioides immitis RMSCC 2394]KMU79520.1 yippee family protein [Coccidioides immitis RMSCC 3703]